MGNLGLKPKKNREFYDWFMITDTRDIDLYWFILIYIDLYWFRLIYIDLYWFILIYIDLHRFILIYIDLYWFMLIHDKWGPHIGGLSEKICRFGGIIFIEKRPVYKLGVSPCRVMIIGISAMLRETNFPVASEPPTDERQNIRTFRWFHVQ